MKKLIRSKCCCGGEFEIIEVDREEADSVIISMENQYNQWLNAHKKCLEIEYEMRFEDKDGSKTTN